MPLELIVGPPNAGRAGAIRRRFAEALGRDPMLVVPTRDDVDRFERELSGEWGLVGGSVVTFPALFEEVARATGAAMPARLTAAQRLWLVRAAVAEAGRGVLRASAASPGFAPAMERLLGELQSEGLDPDTLERRAAEADGDAAHEMELAAVFRAYERLRDAAARCDRHSLAAAATAALRAAADSWGQRPVFLYGFDDLTAEQIELIAALSAAADVTAAVTYEPDREALGARAELLGRLRDDLGGVVAEELPPHSAYTASPVLFHLERHLFEEPERIAEADDGLIALSAAGERAEAEQIGGEVARLLDSGVAPDDIAVVVRSPERHGPLLDEVLGALGIPVAVDSSVRFASSATGRSLIALLRAVGEGGTAEDVLAFLRAPARADPGSVDWLERHLRRNSVRDAGAALEEWERRHWEPDEVKWILESSPAELPRQVGYIARRLAEYPHRREAPKAGRATPLELRAAAAAEAALREVAELPGADPTREDLVALLEELAVPLWRGPAEGRVRVLSPYRVRARRVKYLFVASLQEGEFPSHNPGDPLLGDDRRADLGLPKRRDPELEERYLFYACVSRPSDRLYLSWRDSDDDGQVLPSSPFLEDVEDLLPPGGLTPRRRGLDAVTFDPSDAPSADELARALAALEREADPLERLASLGIPPAVTEPVAERLRAAASAANGLPGPLRSPHVLEELGARELFGGTTLEGYAVCSYRWFVDHELQPRSLEPDSEALTQGGIMHSVLERLYRDPPGDDAMPRPGDVGRWKERAAELLAGVCEERGTADDVIGRVGRRRMMLLIERFLEREADSETVLRPAPELIEAAFGRGGDDAKGPLGLNGLKLHGKIDRVDVAPGGAMGLVRDYKSGKPTPAAKLAEEGKLQPQLYMLALRDLWGIEPIGGVYVPLSAKDAGAARARGVLDKREKELLAGEPFVRTDFLDEDELTETLDDAHARASQIAADMRAGRITRDPPENKCPRYCRFQPICRRERAVVVDDPDEEPEEEER